MRAYPAGGPQENFTEKKQKTIFVQSFIKMIIFANMKKYTAFLLCSLLSVLLFSGVISQVRFACEETGYAVARTEHVVPGGHSTVARIVGGTGTDCLNFILKDLTSEISGNRENNGIYSNPNGKVQDHPRASVSGMSPVKWETGIRRADYARSEAVRYLPSFSSYYIALRQIRI